MKTVIRKGVFETNSSSTHSLSLQKVKSKEIDKNASFEIRSPLAKTVTMLGLIDNAEDEFRHTFYVKDEFNDNAEKIKKETLDRIKEIDAKLLENINLEEISSYEIAQILTKIDNLERFYKVEDFNDFDEFIDKKTDFEFFFFDDIKEQRILTRFKALLIEEYAKIINKPIEEAKEEVDFEAFAYIELKDALADEKNAKENIEKLMKRDYGLRIAFEKSDSDNLLEFSKKYLYENYLEFKNQSGRKYCCHRYFCNGSLDDCDCGLEKYEYICSALGITIYTDDSKLRDVAKAYLSDEYKLVAEESLGYSMKIKSGEIF